MATIAGLGFGAFLITSKFASQGAVLWPLAYSRMASTGLAAAMLWASHVRRRGHSPGPKIRGGRRYILWLLLVAGSAGVFEVAGNFLYMLATLSGRLDVVAVLSSLYPAGPILLGIWILKERATPNKALGMALALAAVAVISL